jgi:hypothetical protein
MPHNVLTLRWFRPAQSRALIKNSGESNYDKRRWADVFAQSLAKSNPNFDRARFFNAAWDYHHENFIAA